MIASRISPNGILIARYVRDGVVKIGAEVERREKMKRAGCMDDEFLKRS